MFFSFVKIPNITLKSHLTLHLWSVKLCMNNILIIAFLLLWKKVEKNYFLRLLFSLYRHLLKFLGRKVLLKSIVQ